MSLTREQALSANEFHHGNCRRTIGKRGGVKESITRARRNGRTQTWKRDATRWRVPIKLGLYQYGDITPERAREWHVPEDCPLNQTDGAVALVEHIGRIQQVTIPVFRHPFYRAVCTCGYYGAESPSAEVAARDSAHHAFTAFPNPEPEAEIQ